MGNGWSIMLSILFIVFPLIDLDNAHSSVTSTSAWCILSRCSFAAAIVFSGECVTTCLKHIGHCHTHNGTSMSLFRTSLFLITTCGFSRAAPVSPRGSGAWAWVWGMGSHPCNIGLNPLLNPVFCAKNFQFLSLNSRQYGLSLFQLWLAPSFNSYR